MVEAAWGWFAASPIRYWLVATPFGAALVLAALFPTRLPKWGFIALLGATFVAFRWPIAFYGSELNADESQVLAAARTLMAHPLFWQSVDAHAIGPLDVYPLTLLGWLGFPLDYATARITGYFLDFAAVTALFLLFREVYGDRLARAAALVPTAYFCLVRYWAVAHFSTEAVPAALFAVGFAALWIGARNGRIRLVGFGALLLGAVPWAKIQGMPAAIVGISCGILYIWRRWKSDPATRRRLVITAAFGICTVTVLFALVLTFGGLWGDSYNAYIRAGQDYLQAAADPKPRVLAYFLTVGALGYWTIAIPLFAAITLLLGTCLFHARRERALLGTLGLCVLAAFYATLAPARLYPHYVLLTVFPLSAFAGALLGSLAEPGVAGAFLGGRPCFRTASIGAFLVMTLVPSIAFTASSDVSPQYTFPAGMHRLQVQPVAEAILKIAQPSDTMTIWGWEPLLYVQTGLSQGTHEAHTERQIVAGPMQEFYRSRFLADLKRNPPKIFVDAVGPGRFAYQDRRRQGSESWPDLFLFVSTKYRLVNDLDGYRVFVLAESPR